MGSAWFRGNPIIALYAVRMRSVQLQFPGLADEILAEAVVRFLAHQSKARALINAVGGQENALRPQSDAGITGLAGEADAFRDERLAQPEAARGGIDVEQP